MSISLVLLVHEQTDSYATAGLATAGYGLGSALGAPIFGRMLDRREPRRVLPGMALTFAAALVAVTQKFRARSDHPHDRVGERGGTNPAAP